MAEVELASDAAENGFACMLYDLLRQNIEAKPHKRNDLRALRGRVAIVADDADVAVTLHFAAGSVTIHDGIDGVPDLAVRGEAEVIMTMSNMPITLGLPFARKTDEEGKAALDAALLAMKEKRVVTYGMWRHPMMLLRFTRLLSIHG
ncbi:MAG: hypothetical protein U0174_24070 [Polyangiaceae bacterium]